MRNLVYIIVLALSILPLWGCGSRSLVTGEIDKTHLLFLHNRERMMKSFEILDLDPELEDYAQHHAEWMANHSSLIHSNIRNIKGYQIVGENIAWGQSSNEEVVGDWMNSSGHRANILKQRYTHAGFGYARTTDGRPYWCAVFGGN